MVTVEIDNSHNVRIFLCCNCSASWQTNLRVITAFALFSLLIAGAFSFYGAWLILPFAGLEVVVLTAVVYLWFRYGRRSETVCFSRDEVSLEQANGFSTRYRSCQRDSVRVKIEQGNDWHLPRVWLQCLDVKIEIGQFLNHADKKHLIRELGQYSQLERYR